ncbi:MAG: ATP-binding protein [Chloroflexi bacterium]|nr:ATP-binding protein [Chloroflexota bacterium]
MTTTLDGPVGQREDPVDHGVRRDVHVADLEARLRVIEACVADAVARRRAVDPDPDDRFRGLYIPDATVDQLLLGRRPLLGPAAPPGIRDTLDAVEATADDLERAGEPVRTRRLVRAFGLDGVDLDILLVALAPDLDPRFERLYAYLQDDVSRRRASTGLALELATGLSGPSPARGRLDPGAPLVAGGLLLVEDPERPFLTRSLRVPDRVAAHLLGDDRLDARLEPIRVAPVGMAFPEGRAVSRGLERGSGLVYVRERLGAAGMALSVAALESDGRAVLALDVTRLAPTDDPRDIAGVAERECRLTGAVLLAGPLEVLVERGPAAVRAFGELACPTVLVGSRTWDPAWSRRVPVLIEASLPSLAARAAAWTEQLGEDAGANGPVEGASLDAAALTIQFRMGPDQIARAARAAWQQAAAEDRPLAPDDLRAGARAQNAAGLERLARRIRPGVGWEDLVLPTDIVAQLRELAARARYRDVVLDGWGMGRAGASRGRGLTALFAGDSGTGKTMSAEVMAAELGLDLYVIDLSTVIDKYVGETEKNLDRIFSEADRVNGVLLFDEADAVFGKRSDVRDSHDRYANVEVAYLLQRMEQFDGVAILTTNLRSNLDEAFTRRLDALVDFPVPEEDDRLRLWERHLPPGVPRGDDLDLPFLARRFRLSGGNIRNVSLAAAYLAAASGRPVMMEDLVLGMATEYRKLGRLCVEAEFGRYHHLVARSD